MRPMELQSARERAGLTASALAARARVNAETIRRIERGECSPRLGTWHRIEKALTDVSHPQATDRLAEILGAYQAADDAGKDAILRFSRFVAHERDFRGAYDHALAGAM
jgi:predicted transcriptional regulator